MDKVIRIGVDTSKSVFQVHGVNATEEPVLRKSYAEGRLSGFSPIWRRH